MERMLGLLLLVAAQGAALADEGDTNASRYDAVRRYCRTSDVALYSYHLKHIGNAQGHLAPIIATSDGGFLVVGTRSDNKPGKYKVGKSRPVVIKLDASATPAWEKAYKKAGFLDYEGASAVETADGGFIVYILSYVHPARGSVTRLLKLSRSGEIVWERQLRGNGGKLTPFPQTIRLAKNGSLVMTGHIYRDSSETAYGWEGEVDSSGKVKVDKIGEANPYGRHGRDRQ